ncbi:MAG: hypothetical protein QOD83_3267 [Solirubrobacteraceae bacterium]|jgi:hypothetical protein|nr:hypothetical protein [Solirubrobacteraceae bacterium]
MHEPAFCAAAAFLDDQVTILGDWDPRQYIALELSDDDGELEPVEAALTSQEARDLAFRLLVLAEHADRRARGQA